MLREDFIEQASPPCSDCGEPVQRTESTWRRLGDGSWAMNPFVLVCGRGHRVPLSLEAPDQPKET